MERTGDGHDPFTVKLVSRPEGTQPAKVLTILFVFGGQLTTAPPGFNLGGGYQLRLDRFTGLNQFGFPFGGFPTKFVNVIVQSLGVGYRTHADRGFNSGLVPLGVSGLQLRGYSGGVEV